ncbi:hypothetical protein BH10ACT2_BH10ACT2_19550 [soil metagenome]
MVDDVTHYDAVEAYCDQLSYSPGEVVGVHVWCSAATYNVDVRRWGGDVCWSAAGLVGEAHVTPENADSHGCDWPIGVSVPVAADWQSGMYLVTLRAPDAPSDRAVGYAMFIVRAPIAARKGAALLVIATNTYSAYNNWGGRSLYTGGHRVSFDRPFGRGMLVRPHTERADRKSPPVHFGEQPDTDGAAYQDFRNEHGYPGYMSSAGWWTYERRFVEWAEREGVDLQFAASSDLANDPTALDGYTLVVGAGHDEYWSAAQREAIEAHVARGGNYASFSGNTMFWQVRLEDDGRSMACHKYSAHKSDPVLGTADEQSMSGMWADPVVQRPEWTILGAGSAFGLYSRFGLSTPRGAGAFTVYRHDHWMFEGTGLRYGDQLGRDDGVVGYETVGCRLGFDDHQLPIALSFPNDAASPSDMEVVAFTPSSNLGKGDYPASIAALGDQCDLEFIAERIYGDLSDDSLARARYGNAAMLTCKPAGESGGTVATIGSTDWVYGLNDPLVAQVTTNVMRRLS